MANSGKPKVAKTNEKTRLPVSKKASGETQSAETTSAEKKVSQKLLETIERRKKSKAAGSGKGPMFSRPMGRRGRRPKGAVEYTPENQEEDSYGVESDYEGIEYDTGIRVKQAKDESGFNLDYDYDEELNFDR